MADQAQAEAQPKGRRRRRRGDRAGEGAPRERGFGGRHVAPGAVVLCALFFAVLGLVLIYALWQFWPPAIPPSGKVRAFYRYRFAVWTFFIPREKSLLVVVAISGALGSMIYVIRSFFRYVGERRLIYSWLLNYFLSPLAGAGLATAVYIVLRAGLISGGGTSADPFGFAAVGILVGMFVQQAAEKMKDVFETLFSKVPQGSEPIEPEDGGVPPSGAPPGPPGGSVEELGLVDESHVEALEPDTSPEATAEANLTIGQAPESILEPEPPPGAVDHAGDILEPETPEVVGDSTEILEPDTSPEAAAEADVLEGQPPGGHEEHHGDEGGHGQ